MNGLALDLWNAFLSEVDFVLRVTNGDELIDFDKEIIIQRLEMKKLTEQEITVFSKTHPMPKAVEKIVYDYLDQKKTRKETKL